MTQPKLLTQSRLKELLKYDAKAGIFTWLVYRSGSKGIGHEAGCISRYGYRQICVDGAKYLAHRLVFLYLYGEFPPDEIDHINHIRDDNRRINLRRVSRQPNMKNRKLPSTNMSNHIGVCWYKDGNKWQANIVANGKKIHLGYFTEKSAAIAARKAASIKYGFNANHGKVM